MGITSTIADSLEEYLALAIRLGQDAVARQAIRQQIAAQKERFYADPAPIAGLTTFLEDMAYGR
jgi:predicted O-linked N-acetylglucosamine transferase (SPINDLY family)